MSTFRSAIVTLTLLTCLPAHSMECPMLQGLFECYERMADTPGFLAQPLQFNLEITTEFLPSGAARYSLKRSWPESNPSLIPLPLSGLELNWTALPAPMDPWDPTLPEMLFTEPQCIGEQIILPINWNQPFSLSINSESFVTLGSERIGIRRIDHRDRNWVCELKKNPITVPLTASPSAPEAAPVDQEAPASLNEPRGQSYLKQMMDQAGITKARLVDLIRMANSEDPCAQRVSENWVGERLRYTRIRASHARWIHRAFESLSLESIEERYISHEQEEEPVDPPADSQGKDFLRFILKKSGLPLKEALEFVRKQNEGRLHAEKLQSKYWLSDRVRGHVGISEMDANLLHWAFKEVNESEEERYITPGYKMLDPESLGMKGKDYYKAVVKKRGWTYEKLAQRIQQRNPNEPGIEKVNSSWVTSRFRDNGVRISEQDAAWLESALEDQEDGVAEDEPASDASSEASSSRNPGPPPGVIPSLPIMKAKQKNPAAENNLQGKEFLLYMMDKYGFKPKAFFPLLFEKNKGHPHSERIKLHWLHDRVSRTPGVPITPIDAQLFHRAFEEDSESEESRYTSPGAAINPEAFEPRGKDYFKAKIKEKGWTYETVANRIRQNNRNEPAAQKVSFNWLANRLSSGKRPTPMTERDIKWIERALESDGSDSEPEAEDTGGAEGLRGKDFLRFMMEKHQMTRSAVAQRIRELHPENPAAQKVSQVWVKLRLGNGKIYDSDATWMHEVFSFDPESVRANYITAQMVPEDLAALQGGPYFKAMSQKTGVKGNNLARLIQEANAEDPEVQVVDGTWVQNRMRMIKITERDARWIHQFFSKLDPESQLEKYISPSGRAPKKRKEINPDARSAHDDIDHQAGDEEGSAPHKGKKPRGQNL